MSLNKKLKKELANAPKYKIQDEAFQNQAIARANAYGRDRSIQAQQTQLDQDAQNAVSSAKDVTSSTSGLLSTIAAIQANKDQTTRGLAQDEAALQQQKLGTLMNTNQAMIDEKDKEWNYNVNEPYQNRIQALRDRKKARGELVGSIIGGVASIGAGLATGGASSLFKAAS
jgi:hypothetical protein